MDETTGGQCPDCGNPLEDGSIGFTSGIAWFEVEPTGRNRFIPLALKYGRYAVGNMASTFWYRTRPARRCPACKILVVREDRRN